MTKLTESAIYSPTIFRLETTTPVAGGEVILDGNDDPVQGYANAQAQLLANRTKYLKGVTDTLGTAAYANLTTSTTDTTAGRVLKVGDLGLPDTPNYMAQPALASADGTTDLSTINRAGWWGKLLGGAPGSRPANFPTGQLEQHNYVYLHTAAYSTNFTQTAYSYASSTLQWPRMWLRCQTSGVDLPWAEMWSSYGVNSLVTDTGSIGFGTGSGGTVEQATSKTTGVTLNKPSGQITTASNALAANTAVSFVLTNNKIAANDIPKVVIKSGATAGAYVVQVDAVAAGSCCISIRNMTVGALSEALVLQFNIEKGATA